MLANCIYDFGKEREIVFSLSCVIRNISGSRASIIYDISPSLLLSQHLYPHFRLCCSVSRIIHDKKCKYVNAVCIGLHKLGREKGLLLQRC